MKTLYLMIIAIFFTFQILAQNPDGQLSDVTFGKTAITQFSESIESSHKPYYIDESWLSGEFQILNGVKFRDLPMRFNMIDNQLYFKDRNVVRVISARLLKAFSWTNSEGEIESFITGNTFNLGKDDIYRIELKDSVSLYSRYYVKIIKANYNEALSVGDKTDQIKLVKEYFYQLGNSQLIMIPNSRKKVSDILTGKYAKTVSNFINTEKLKFKNEEDFFELIKYWNSLFTKSLE
ncbi:hypothetical protein [Fulvivirga lutimaris]|uniref:hypothetical protein n=1 Tax=Fulvivirga lutimaris TaxID=1819566 RepID=UPI0012BB9EE0|nr:hypothetical protein [Fulvivirga lutimaris]MTI37969.1 hypothetical protein [Fulvivirga lutimaris]